MDKLKAIWHLLISRNYVVICDRNASASIRTMFRDSYTKELRSMAYRLSKVEETKGKK